MAESLAYDRSNYTICRVVARRSPVRKEVAPPPECAYQPLALRELAADRLIITKLAIPAVLPADIDALLASAREKFDKLNNPNVYMSGTGPWEIKSRSCDSITYLRIGNFSEYPGFLNRYLQSAFGSDLAVQARSVLAMLAAADSITELDTYDFVRHVCGRRYPLYLQLQSLSPTVILIPPIDVQAAWFTHMLQSDCYTPWIKHHWPVIASLSHTAVRSLSTEQIEAGKKKCSELFALSREPWELSKTAPKDNVSSTSPIISPNTVMRDRAWYRQFLASTTNNKDIMKDEFYSRAALGYQRYMFLIAKWPQRIEAHGFAPSPPIDLIWHTHLAQPAQFHADWTRLLGQVHHHKLLEISERRKRLYHLKTEFESKIWNEEFAEEFKLYASELTHKPKPFEEHEYYPNLPPPAETLMREEW